MQSINFLKDLPKDTSRLTVAMMAWIIFGVFIFLFCITVIISVKQFNVHRSINATNKVLNDELMTYDELVKKYPLLGNNIPLAKQIQDLQKKVDDRAADYAALEHLTVRPGFSQFMYDLAQTVPASLWFNQIMIHLDISSVTLGGFAVRPDDVSVLMSRLMKSPAFNKIVFNLFFVKAVNSRPYVKFSIATDDLGEDDDSEDQAKAQAKE